MSLKATANTKKFNVGVSVSSSSLLSDLLLRQLVVREFNTITTETDMKFSEIQPNQGDFDFSGMDALMDFAAENNIRVRGHALIWHNSVPDWLKNGLFSRTEIIEIMRVHIRTVVSRYKDRVFAWDVVNEAFMDNGAYRNSFWLQKIGPQYIELAFKFTRESDPDGLLFYNDYGIEGINSKSNAVYKLFSTYKKYGLADLIDGIGFQMHFNVNSQINFPKISQNINRLGLASLQVHFTEIDVALSTNTSHVAEELAIQSTIYKKIFEVALRSGGICNTCIVWGTTDKYSWLGRNRKPLLFDYNYIAKPSYYSVLQAIVLN